MMNFVSRKIIFFSLTILPFASSAPIVDESYTSSNQSHQDVYDAIFNAFFPIFFIFLTNISGSSGKIRKILLPVLDDLLYNTVTWVIPLTVSFAYVDFLAIKLFSILNMGLHVLCAVYALIKHKKIWIIYITTITHIFDSISILFITLFGILLIS